MPLFEIIDTPQSYEKCFDTLSKAHRMAIDVEANSLHAYQEQVCLLQISTDHVNYIIDPLSNINLEPIDQLLQNPAVEKVFHAAEYDLTLLKNEFGWSVCNLFDTMWAGRLLGFPRMGLAWFLKSMYGIEMNKKHQKANWAERPLSPEKLAYACNDTCHLLRMRDDLAKMLKERGLEEEAHEIFRDLCQKNYSRRKFDPEGFWKLPGARTLNPRGQALLKALYIFRDTEAKRQNVPPFKILGNGMLVHLAHVASHWNGSVPQDLGSVGVLPKKLVNQYNDALVKVIHKALQDSHPMPVKPGSCHSPGYWQRYELLSDWRKELALQRGVESDVILSRTALEAIAEAFPKSKEELEAISSMSSWRIKQYGDAILHVLNSHTATT